MDDDRLGLSQWISANCRKRKAPSGLAMDTLMARLGLQAKDLKRIILTGSFGGQIDISSAVELGMIPPVPLDRVETIPNGAGLGAAMFLSESGFELGERLAEQAQQVDLDKDTDFISRYIGAMALTPNNTQIGGSSARSE